MPDPTGPLPNTKEMLVQVIYMVAKKLSLVKRLKQALSVIPELPKK